MLSLLASKSWQGHTEPSAGLVGIKFAAAAAGALLQAPILHLRTLNPTVAGLLGALGPAGHMAAGRQ